jgi:aspartyl-tRNA(Asn)/glutamyl-tRNA(Gln) amidotransferase subunit A
VSDPADLGVVDAAALLARRELSSRELVEACLARIRARDGVHSHDGDPASVNAWVRVYEEDALAAAARADERLARGDAPPLCGVPVGLKDLFAVAGKPLTASSRLLDEVPARDSDVWARLSAAGMVLLGHLHTHEFAAGGTTDQVGNPWALDRSAGGSSGGSAAALAAGMTPAATGTDTAGSLRIPSALCGTATLKPSRGLVSLRGVVPLGPTLDHAGPMARTLADCAPLFAAMLGLPALLPSTKRFSELRIAVSPRLGLVELDPDVAAGYERALDACRRLGATLVEPPPPDAPLDAGADLGEVLLAELLPYHRRFDGRRDLYRPSLRAWVEAAEARASSAEEYVTLQARRAEETFAWSDWLAEQRLDALLEPTVPVVAPLRGSGYEDRFFDADLISLTRQWNWTGFPVAALPAGVGARSGLPVGVSLIGPPGRDFDVLAAGIELQAELPPTEAALVPPDNLPGPR